MSRLHALAACLSRRGVDAGMGVVRRGAASSTSCHACGAAVGGHGVSGVGGLDAWEVCVGLELHAQVRGGFVLATACTSPCMVINDHAAVATKRDKAPWAIK